MADKTHCVVLEVGQPPEVREIDTSLETMQSIVGGNIERVPLSGPLGFTVFVNEMGRFDGLPFNVGVEHHALFGTVLIVGPSDSEGDQQLLDLDEAERIASMISDLSRGAAHHA